MSVVLKEELMVIAGGVNYFHLILRIQVSLFWIQRLEPKMMSVTSPSQSAEKILRLVSVEKLIYGISTLLQTVLKL